MRREENRNDPRKSFVQSGEYPNLAEGPFGFKNGLGQNSGPLYFNQSRHLLAASTPHDGGLGPINPFILSQNSIFFLF